MTDRHSPHILIYCRDPQPFQRWLQAKGCPGRCEVASDPETAQLVVEDVDVILGSKFPSVLFSRATSLRWYQSINAGVEDLLVADGLPPDVVVTRVVDQFGGPISEYVFAELLSRVRQIERLRRQQARRRWNHFIADTLAGKVLGVAGLGSIGREIVRKGKAFDMVVYGLSRRGARADCVDRHFGGEVHPGPSVWLDFVRDLDVLVLSLPLTPATEGVVSAQVLGAMPSRAILVNVGRGRLIDEAALICALQKRQIAGAILDVFTHEPLPMESPLWSLPGVTVTPHVAGPSTIEGVGRLFLGNLHRYMNGRKLVGVVDRTRGY